METLREFSLCDGRARILCLSHLSDISGQWFQPGYWGDRARPVDAGGRGAAWFVETPDGAVVLRQYRRGGLMARLSERSYAFLGFDRTRSFAELRLLQVLRDQGLPVPEPVAAMAERRGGFTYRAWIMVRRIPDAVPMPDAANLGRIELWQRVGALIRRFHDVGLDHADLNCDNILVAGDELYLIDFDKCRLRRPESGAWQAGNLKRLRRSVDKRCRHLPEDMIERLWAALREGYDA